MMYVLNVLFEIYMISMLCFFILRKTVDSPWVKLDTYLMVIPGLNTYAMFGLIKAYFVSWMSVWSKKK